MQQLKTELLRRIFGNLGAFPGDKYGSVGVVASNYLFPRNIQLLISDEQVEDFPVWAAQLNCPPFFKILITNVGTVKSPNFYLALSSQDSAINIGFELDWEGYADFLICRDGVWAPAPPLYCLNLAVAFETIVQNGLMWEKFESYESFSSLYERLLDLIESEN